MKKLTILSAMLLLLSVQGTAQQNMSRALVKKMLQAHHPEMRNDIAPEKSTYTTLQGDASVTKSDIFFYDEDEHLLLSVETRLGNQADGLPFALQTYEYDMYSNLSEVLTQLWDGSEWTNQDRVSIEYQHQGLPFPSKETFQTWQDNNWVNVKQHIYNYDPVITVLVKDWFGDHFGNHYLYTYESEGDVTTVLLQFWKDGAWQNQEYDTYYFDENLQTKEIVHQVWENNMAWQNEFNYRYLYDGPYQLNQITIVPWINGAWSTEQVKTLQYTHDGMGNSLHAISTSSYYTGEALNANIELFYNEGESIVYENVSEVEMIYVDLTHLGETPAEGPLTLCPNPALGQVVVRGEGFEHAEVYSLTGQRLLVSRSATIELQELATGAYLVKLYRLDGSVATQKLLVR